MDKSIRKSLINANRIVIKVGTSTLTYNTGKVNISKIYDLVRVISDLVNKGKEIVLVTSGAIGVGVGKLRMSKRPTTIEDKQAAAAVGQSELMHMYSKFFSDYGHIVGQILLTKDVVDYDQTRKNVINTFESLLKRNVIPVVNENDTVSIEEIENLKHFGDNDTLSATVAKLINADLLIILSDIDGLYDEDPRKNPGSKMIDIVYEITDEIESLADGAGTDMGTGGMQTKINAVKMASSAGINVVITNGENPEIILKIINGEKIGTLFVGRREGVE